MEKDNLAFKKVDEFLPNKIYYHGCLKSFLHITKWKGPEVPLFMYFFSKLLLITHDFACHYLLVYHGR